MTLLSILMLISAVPLSSEESGQGRTLVTFESEADFSSLTLSHVRWSSKSGGVVFDESVPGDSPGAFPRGVVESGEIKVPDCFNQAVVSWNAFTPPGSYLVFYLKARVGGVWTNWYNMGLWNRDGRPEPRTSSKDKDESGCVDTDTLILNSNADAFKIRVELSTVDCTTYPTLRFLSIDLLDTSIPDVNLPPKTEAWGKELDVPELCQLSVQDGNEWCSPTSTAMVLGYWSKKLGRPELAVGITETAASVHDKAWHGTGNWVFNTAFAGEFPGIRAYVTRFNSVSQIEEWLAKGVPVIVSVDYNKLNRRNRTDRMGHLMVIRGFTRDGDVIFNDPWARLEDGQKVRKIFKREDLEYAWMGANGSYGTVYLIYPEK